MPMAFHTSWVKENELTEDAKQHIERLNGFLFPENLHAGRYRFGQKQSDPHRLLLWDGHAMAGQLLAVRRDVRINGDSLHVLYVGELGLFPEYQGKGLGKLLLTSLSKYVPKDIDVTLLCCVPEKQGFYEKCGWSLLRLPVWLGDTATSARCAQGIVMVRILTPRGKEVLARESTRLFLGQSV